MRGAILVGAFVLLLAGAAWGQEDFEARCASCHTVQDGGPAQAGPHLARLAGRRIAGDPGFDYSPALRTAAGVWTAERLASFLEDPEEMFPGLWMGANGVRDAASRRRIVEYLMAR